MNSQISKKINPLVNEIFPEQDLHFKYKVKKIIGKGQYGYVAKALRKNNNQFVAIKKLFNIFHNQSETKRILRQIILLKTCNHPNIISLIEIFLPKNQTLQNFDQIYIVTEYCDTDLRNLFKLEDTFLDLSDVKHIFYQIVCGIKYLHSASIVHRDLTPSNILINGQGMNIKICDLGLARIIDDKQKNSKHNVQITSESSQQQEKNYQKQIMEQNDQIQQNVTFNQTLKSQFNTPKNEQNRDFQKNVQPKKENIGNLSQQQKQELDDCLISQKNSRNFNQPLKPEFLTKQLQPQYLNNQTKNKKRLSRMNSIRKNSDEGFNQTKNKNKEQRLQYENKINKKDISQNPLAKLTLRVTTRWYRAPQLILLQKGYSKPIDLWSLGCLFGQLLKMIKSVCYNSLQRFPLFPGKYCYPVSPQTLNNINKHTNSTQNYKNDQLFMILSTIGKPTQKQMNYLTDQEAKQYIRSMENLQRKEFKKFFPQLPSEAIDILQKTLLFDPRERISIQQCLNHSFLQSIRNKQLEKQANPIVMNFQSDDKLTLEKLRINLIDQIKHYF